MHMFISEIALTRKNIYLDENNNGIGEKIFVICDMVQNSHLSISSIKFDFRWNTKLLGYLNSVNYFLFAIFGILSLCQNSLQQPSIGFTKSKDDFSVLVRYPRIILILHLTLIDINYFHTGMSISVIIFLHYHTLNLQDTICHMDYSDLSEKNSVELTSYSL